MSQLLNPGWWFSFFPQAAGWYFFCLICSIAALPLCMRMFRGLADRGAGLSIGVGIIFTTYFSWLLSLKPFGTSREFSLIALLLLAGASGWSLIALVMRSRGYVRGRAAWAIFVPSGVLAILALLPLSFGAFSVYTGLVLLAICSAAAWITDLPGLVRQLRVVAVPLALSHLIFFASFLFFVNVRSYIPWATFILEQPFNPAEKWGNLTHINSIMTSDHMPPRDLWFVSQPINYYYGGHLVTASIAKATGTAPEFAFNLGLATYFALTMSMSFCFVLSLVHLTTRKFRLVGPLIWHFGVGWALFGMLAISMFGNLDPWRQLLTRDLDGGVRTRWERNQRSKAEDWKLAHGISPSRAFQLVGGTSTMQVNERARAVVNEAKRVRVTAEENASKLTQLAAQVKDRLATARTANTDDRRIATELYDLAFSPGNAELWKDQTGVNAIEAEDHAYALLAKNDFDGFVSYIQEVVSRDKSDATTLDRIEKNVEGKMKAAVESGALKTLREKVLDPDYASSVGSLFRFPPETVAERIDPSDPNADFSSIYASLLDFQSAAGADKLVLPKDVELGQSLKAAIEPFEFNPTDVVYTELGTGFENFNQTAPTIDDIRFTWENASLVNFWDSSRAIKGTPAGDRTAGTITEFPYFSAILGDHHPHHMALPFTLAALCACVSLLRKNSRCRSTDGVFIGRSWTDLLAMAFFIGAVFPVNIWDAVVLAPLYGVVILVARKGIRPHESWKWLGFAGFIILLGFLIGLVSNTVPGIVPIFLHFKLFGAVAVLMAIAIPVSLVYTADRRRHVALLSIIAGALALIAIGAISSGIGVAVRDVAMFAIIAGLAAWWTLPGRGGVGNWWYSAGGVYAAVGVGALLVIVPFKLFFHSPLQPNKEMFASLLPPILSHDLTSATGNFWQAFWQASPINPFPENLRTDLRDFVMHWGIFFIPVFFFAIARFFRAGKGQPAGFSFMIAMVVLGVVGFSLDYLQYWVGPISLGMMVVSLYYAFQFRRCAESPAWAFLAVAFFWTWFVEALHFDDDYAGNLERYNTPFKIYYPLWPIFAGGMVVALREMFGRFSYRERTPRELLLAPEYWTLVVLAGIGVPLLLQHLFPESLVRIYFFAIWIAIAVCTIAFSFAVSGNERSRHAEELATHASRSMTRFPAGIAVFVILVLGMYYPIAATATRTRAFFTWPLAGSWEARQDNRRIYTDRTLDSLAYLDEYELYRGDHKAMMWIRENLPRDAKVLERSGPVAYSSIGRIATGSGRPTIMGWMHHEGQWRGRAAPAPYELKVTYYDRVEGLGDQGLGDLNGAFGEILDPEPVAPVSNPDQRKLRIASPGKRTELLRGLFPTASNDQLLRMKRAVARDDVNMGQIAEVLRRDADAIYTNTDRAEVARLLTFYGMDYVVFGPVENEGYFEGGTWRTSYGPEPLARFKDWGFETVFDSSPDDKTDRSRTVILKVPDSFRLAVPAK